MDIQLITQYWDNPEAREAFKAFIQDIHGLDFSEWEARGYWDDAYAPFSYFKDGRVISSVCIYLLDAIVAGRQTKLAQISGVGTHKNWRRKGLSRKLTELGLQWAEGRHQGVFLFADEEAIPFYHKCGFLSIKDGLEFTHADPVPKKQDIVSLDPSDQKDLDKIYTYAKNKTPISDKFSVSSAKLLMFHALYTMRSNLYEIPALESLVFFARKGDIVNVYDIVSECIPPFEEIYPYLSSKRDSRINFYFHTDKLGIRGVQTEINTGNNTFVKKSFPVSTPVFPFTSMA